MIKLTSQVVGTTFRMPSRLVRNGYYTVTGDLGQEKSIHFQYIVKNFHQWRVFS
jgi:hypothetical protein